MLVKLNNRGDTIVEVLIVLAVLGLAIGISYATANRSLLNARQAQESSEASVLLQSQLEALRVQAPTQPAAIFQDDHPFCIDPASSSVVIYNDAVPSNCRYNNLYKVKISYNPSHDTFTLTATWADVLGHGFDNSTLVYRIHQ